MNWNHSKFDWYTSSKCYKSRNASVYPLLSTGCVVFYMSRTVKGYRKSATLALHYHVMLQTVDSDYIREEQKFKNMESAVKLMVRDVVKYLDQLCVSAGSSDAPVFLFAA